MRREVDPDPYCPQAALVDEETNRRTEERLARFRAKFEAEKRHRKQVIAMREQRLRMWTAGAALAAATLCWLWYKRRATRKGGRGRRGNSGADNDDGNADYDGPQLRDLLLEEEEEGTEEELRQVFDEAAEAARKLPDNALDRRDQLMLYGLYKQAKEGDRNTAAPSKIDVVARAKYDSWGKFEGLPKKFAMRRYCEVVYHFSKGGASAYDDDDDADVAYDEDEVGDVDEDGCPVDGEGDGDDDSADAAATGMGARRQSTMAGCPDAISPRIGNDSSAEARLRAAALSDDVAALEELMSGGCSIDDGDDVGQTALHFAADRGSIGCLKLLVEGGANVNAVDCDGIGVLQTALSAGVNAESVKILLESGADPDAGDVDGYSSRMWVMEEGDKDTIDLFASFPKR